MKSPLSAEPISDRSDEMLALHLPSGHGKVSRGFTSGSTGIPISFRKNKLFVIVSRAANWRFSKWVGWGWLKTNADFPPNFDESRANQEGFYLGSRGPPWLEGSRGTSIVLSRGNKEADHLALLRRFNVQSISSTPNYVEILAHENLMLPAPSGSRQSSTTACTRLIISEFCSSRASARKLLACIARMKLGISLHSAKCKTLITLIPSICWWRLPMSMEWRACRGLQGALS